ncbi:proline--tRNA ligase [Candidatus Microgenomates bacterium]|nr:proline--tRNA ligase [Candidatus Microgenomates bacterium]
MRYSQKDEDFSGWYNEVVLKAELADYGPVRGTMIFRPYGYALWEAIQKELDEEIKKAGVPNTYFPLFIPEKFLKKEKEHLEGFSPELAVVTIGGGEKLAEPLVLRPTSETVIYSAFAKWISSWRELPLKVNQWCNVVRWEKRPYLFLRTTEFLWQEGHTAHATHEESLEEVFRALKMYQKLYEETLAIAGYAGMKSQKEKFAGALNTYTFEMLMPDGKVLQGCTSHDLGQNFSKAFEVMFQDKNGKREYVWQTSWGLATRSVGAMIMEHGDERGLILPPKIAPIQVVIIPIIGSGKIEESARACEDLKKNLEEEGIRVKLDNREEQSPGRKFNEWELKGVPIRLEIGPKEIETEEVLIVRRDNGEKIKVGNEDVLQTVKKLLEEIQTNLLNRSRKFLEENTLDVENYEDFKKVMSSKRGFIRAFWCEDPKCEEKIKEETKATTRCLPLDSPEENGKCIYCGKDAVHRWLFGQAY